MAAKRKQDNQRKITNTEIKVAVHIVPGRGTPAQCQSYKRFFQQLAATVRDEAQGAIK